MASKAQRCFGSPFILYTCRAKRHSSKWQYECPSQAMEREGCIRILPSFKGGQCKAKNPSNPCMASIDSNFRTSTQSKSTSSVSSNSVASVNGSSLSLLQDSLQTRILSSPQMSSRLPSHTSTGMIVPITVEPWVSTLLHSLDHVPV
jgi:hypothetical protein